MSYIALSRLQREQNLLNIDLIEYSLDEEWRSHVLIESLRRKVINRIPSGLFDPQDLEHQVLFRLTTFAPEDINDEIIDSVIREQNLVLEYRLATVVDREFLFRGLSGRSKDLNVKQRLELKHAGNQLYATGYGRTLNVVFKKIEDEATIRLFTEKLHYIHNSRMSGDAFGFYFEGDDIPWGVETVESSMNVKKYKRDALLAKGIDPDKAVEITRLYLLPGSPKNAISILDGLVAKYYKNRGMEAMYTTTMPMYAKTKAATTAGGMRDVLLVKELNHFFKKSKIGSETAYVHDSTKSNTDTSVIRTHPKFPTLYTVETFMRLNENKELKSILPENNMAVYVPSFKRRVNSFSELRYDIGDLAHIFDIIHAKKISSSKTEYIRDSFWGYGKLNKMRLRRKVERDKITYEVSSKYKLSEEQHIRNVINNIFYVGESFDNALSVIKVKNKSYEIQNSLEKVRYSYGISNLTIVVDIYPFGAYLKIIGDREDAKKFTKEIGFSIKDDIKINADDIYLKWVKKKKLDERMDVRFGLD